MAKRIGIMGGTFDPIHNGHLAIAQSVAEQLDFDLVLFIPTGNPNFKQGKNVTPAQVRARMVELAIAGYENFKLDTCEIDRPGVTYSADTLEELTSRFLGAEFFFIMGGDSAATLVHWRRAEELAALCHIVVVQRPGQSMQLVREALENSPIDFSVRYVDVPQIDVSSTLIRERVKRGDTVQDILPRAVADFIEKQGLYKE